MKNKETRQISPALRIPVLEIVKFIQILFLLTILERPYSAEIELEIKEYATESIRLKNII